MLMLGPILPTAELVGAPVCHKSYPSAIMDEVVFDGVSQKQAEHGPDAQAILEEIRQQSWMVRSLALPHHY